MKTGLALFAALAIAGAGCDSVTDAAQDQLPDVGDILNPNQDAGPVVIDIEVEPDTEIKDLTDEEKATVCGKVVNAINQSVPPAEKCDFGGLGAAVSAAREGIETARERCATFSGPCKDTARVGGATAQDQIPEVTFEECAVLKGDVSACTSPVSALTACLTDMAKAMVNTVVQISCNALTLDGLQDTGLSSLGSAVPDTPVCAQLACACPGVFGPGGAGGGDNCGVPGADGGTPTPDAGVGDAG